MPTLFGLAAGVNTTVVDNQDDIPKEAIQATQTASRTAHDAAPLEAINPQRLGVQKQPAPIHE